MASTLVTPPDILESGLNFLVINALDTEIESLCVYLKPKTLSYNIHCYHSGMTDHAWALRLINQVDHVVIKDIYESYIRPELRYAIDHRTESVVRYGSQSSTADLVTFFENLNN